VGLLNPFQNINPGLLIIVFLWTIFWKALALWRSAKNGQRFWFIAFLIVNTLGILEIIYLFGFAKEKMTLEDFKKTNFLP